MPAGSRCILRTQRVGIIGPQPRKVVSSFLPSLDPRREFLQYDRVSPFVGSDVLRQTKVAEDEMPYIVQEYVGWLDIAMDYVLFMKGLNGDDL